MKMQDVLPFLLNLFLFCAGDVCIICTEKILGIHCHNADITSTTFICQEINSVFEFDISSSHSKFICEQSDTPIYVEGDPCPTSTTFLPDVCVICTKEIIGMYCHNADITIITFMCQKINYVFKFDISSSHSNFICEQSGKSIYVKGGPCLTSTTVLPEPGNADKWDRFTYDYQRLQTWGLVCSGVLFILGILSILRSKCPCKFKQASKPRILRRGGEIPIPS